VSGAILVLQEAKSSHFEEELSIPERRAWMENSWYATFSAVGENPGNRTVPRKLSSISEAQFACAGSAVRLSWPCAAPRIEHSQGSAAVNSLTRPRMDGAGCP